MNVTHIILGQPWLYDQEVQHSSKENTQTFFDEKTIVLKPVTIAGIEKFKKPSS